MEGVLALCIFVFFLHVLRGNYERRSRLRVAFFFFKQKTAYELVSCDWSSDVCSSDLTRKTPHGRRTCSGLGRGASGDPPPHPLDRDDDPLAARLRAALTSEADMVQPSDDGLQNIRAGIDESGRRPWWRHP